MSVTVAKTAGFCFGVRRAVDLAEQQAKKNGKIYAYGEIIHNMHEIERLEKLGVYTAYALEDIPDGAGVLIRAHGVPRNVYTLLQAKKCEIFDATCPFVRKIHKIADKEILSLPTLCSRGTRDPSRPRRLPLYRGVSL